MTNHGAAESSFKRARIVLDEAGGLAAANHWNLAVRRSQESVELALKGALAWAGLDVPKVHDVGPLLKQHVHRFPAGFAEVVQQLASIGALPRSSALTAIAVSRTPLPVRRRLAKVGRDV